MPSSPADRNQPLERLRRILLRRWWGITTLLWATVGVLSLWELRPEFDRLRQYFTWTAVRYGLAYNYWAALGLGLCVGLTVALLIAESHHILFGLSRGERQRLEKLLSSIRQRGISHPLWRQVYRDGDSH